MSLTWVFADPAVAHNKRVRARRRAQRKLRRSIKRENLRYNRPAKRRRRWGRVVAVAKFVWLFYVAVFVIVVAVLVLSYSGIRTLISRITSERSHL